MLEKTPQGHRPPQTTLPDHKGQRQALKAELIRLDVEARLGPAYSVFDDRKSGTQHAYFLAAADIGAGSGSLHAIPITDLANLTYTSPAIADMMRRYAREAQTQSFALYLGDSESGETHSLSKGI